MGENIAQLIDVDCEIHGKQLGLRTQHLSPITVCLQCCKEILEHLKK